MCDTRFFQLGAAGGGWGRGREWGELPLPGRPQPPPKPHKGSAAPPPCVSCVDLCRCTADPPLSRPPQRLLSRGEWLSLTPYRSGTISTLLLALGTLVCTFGVCWSAAGFGSACVVMAAAVEVAARASVPPPGSGLGSSMDSASSALLQVVAGAEPVATEAQAEGRARATLQDSPGGYPAE